MDELDPYGSIPLATLTTMLSYATNVLANAPEGYLVDVEEDLREAALTIIPAAEYVEEWRQEDADQTVPPQASFLPPPPKPAPRYLAGREAEAS